MKNYVNKLENLEETDKFWETYNLSILKQEETEKLNTPVTNKEIQIVIKRLPRSKSRTKWIQSWILPTFKEELTQILLKLVQKIGEGILPNSFYDSSLTWYDTARIENYWPISLMHVDAKIFNKILAHWIQQCIKKIIHHDQMIFIPGMEGWFNICKSR